ncbi:Cell division protein FtsZ 1 [Candidatus Anstonella stagnisolia]|nr:Cell division protein FtsZ 1 [Candidatus Anstonella stagnisolia]
MFEDIIKGAAANSVPEKEIMGNEDVQIAIVGVGGGGCNTVDRIMKMGVKGVTTVAVNTDQLHLKTLQAHKRVLIGASITKGLGAGGFPEVGQKCAEASKDMLKQTIGNNQLVFLCAGMGGGTGTGAAPVVARAAKEEGAIVVGMVTYPFSLERARLKKADAGLKQLVKECDTVIVIDNNRLASYVPNLPISDAFKLADMITGKAVTGITDTILFPSLMNVDYADVKSVMENGGVSLISMGEGKGGDRVEQVIKNSLSHPLLDISYEGAKNALLHINGGTALTLGEAIEIGEGITKNFDPKANIKMGARLDPSLGDSISVTAIVTGLQCAQLKWSDEPAQQPEKSYGRAMEMENFSF